MLCCGIVIVPFGTNRCQVLSLEMISFVGDDLKQADRDTLPWQKQPYETMVQYEKFMCYKELPPNDRSYAEAARVYYEDPERSTSDFSKLAGENNWQKRVEAFDRWTSQLINQDQSQRHQQAKRRTADLVANVKDAMIEYIDNFWELSKEDRLEKFDELSMKEFIQMTERLTEIEEIVVGDKTEKQQGLADRLVSALEDDGNDDAKVVEGDVVDGG